MITNHVLEDKWRVQKALSEQAGSEPGRYIALAHKKVLEAQERYGIRFRYVKTEADSSRESREQAEMLREAAEKPLAADGDERHR